MPDQEITHQEEAAVGIYTRIAELTPIVDAEALALLADAYQKVAYGPAGGQIDTDYRYQGETTQHEGESRERHPAGFTPKD